MRKFLAGFVLIVLAGSAGAHAGLYHSLLERPLSIWPAVLVTLGLVAAIFLLEEVRKKRKK